MNLGKPARAFLPLCKGVLREKTARVYRSTHVTLKRNQAFISSSVPTPVFPSLPFLSSDSSLLASTLFRFIFKSSFSPPFLSTTSPLSHSFSVSNCEILCSSPPTFFSNSFAVCSSACSLCFFFTRKRAEAAVFLRRLSSSAARREAAVSGS